MPLDPNSTFKNQHKKFDLIATILVLFFAFSFLFCFNFIQIDLNSVAEENPIAEKKENKNKIENGIHVNSGLVVDDGYELVLRSCGSCHSYKLVTQNNADAAGWTETIRWMQETQKLWDLGANEPKIVAYLAKNYGPKKKFRRKNLENVEWFELD